MWKLALLPTALAFTAPQVPVNEPLTVSAARAPQLRASSGAAEWEESAPMPSWARRKLGCRFELKCTSGRASPEPWTILLVIMMI